MHDAIRSIRNRVGRTECEYCPDSFLTQRGYDRHLRAEHERQLGRIQRRQLTGTGRSVTVTGPLVILAAIGLAVLAVAGVFVATSGPATVDSRSPGAVGTVHTHGPITVEIDGTHLDFGQERYQLQDDAFHFEGGESDRWHVHARGVTLAYAMSTLDIDVTRTSVTFDGTTYRDSDSGVQVSVTVNGEMVTPAEYVLRDGDEIRIIVETE